jgi:hypothetical protein
MFPRAHLSRMDRQQLFALLMVLMMVGSSVVYGLAYFF